jgi:hypothetical protein
MNYLTSASDFMSKRLNTAGLIAPESRAAWVCHKDAKPRWVPADEALDAGPLIIKLTDLWRGLKNKRGNRTK